MKTNKNTKAVICPPCGESVARATKEGQNWTNTLWPLLPRLTAVLPPQGREINKGFTLIELLVVVLIIGILAAVAVPQYQMAVEKSRANSIIPIMRAIRTAQQTYYLANGSYATTFTELAIEPPAGTSKHNDTTIVWPNGQQIDLYSNGISFYPNANISYFLKWYYEGDLFCWASKTNLDAQKACKYIAGKDHGGNESGGLYGYGFKNF